MLGYAADMSDAEMKAVLKAASAKLRTAGYSELAERLAGKQERIQVIAPSGDSYHVEFEGFWDDDEHVDLRIVASIDDGGLRAFLPFTDAFTITPVGTIIEHSTA